MDRILALCSSWSVSDTQNSGTKNLDILELGGCKVADMMVPLDRTC